LSFITALRLFLYDSSIQSKGSQTSELPSSGRDEQMKTTGKRSEPFWDGVEGRATIPRAAATLGFQFVEADVERGTIEVAFEATEDFTNPMGNVLGAFLAAMLYDTVGPTARPELVA
jgi:acyl-coenzyme A thioesterase PaaI-like protein